MLTEVRVLKRTETKKIALASLFCALSVIICIIGCVFDMADLAATAAASVTVALAGIELRGKYPYLIYAVTGTLLFLLFPTSTVTLYFILFFGYYPIIRGILIKLPKLLSMILKFAVFNAAIVAIFFLMKKLLLFEDAETSEAWLIPALWVVANIFFFVFDFSLNIFMMAYIRVFRRKWGIDKFMLH